MHLSAFDRGTRRKGSGFAILRRIGGGVSIGLLVLLTLVLCSSAALGQRTGGRAGGFRSSGSSYGGGSSYRSSGSSYGGGSSYRSSGSSYGSSGSGSSSWWRSSSSSSSSSGSSRSSYGSSSYGNSSYGNSGYTYSPGSRAPVFSTANTGRWSTTIIIVCVLVLLFALAMRYHTTAQQQGFIPPSEMDFRPRNVIPPNATLARVTIAFDWTARRELQRRLKELSNGVDLDNEVRFQQFARAVVTVLKGTSGKRYAFLDHRAVPEASAESAYTELTDDLRRRYQVETRSNEVTNAAPEVRNRSEEGEGMLVVTLVACRAPGARGMFDRKLDSIAQVNAAIDELVPNQPAMLQAFEVIWSPTEENDRMSSAELEVLYPELARLDNDHKLGRITCAYCQAVFAGELGRCPSCGGELQKPTT